MATVRDRAAELGCRRLHLTSEPGNTATHMTWIRRGFTNVPGGHTVNGVSVMSGYKGFGKHRAVYELHRRARAHDKADEARSRA
ncbi:hypothetical protein ACPZ19_48840 [Amycolatopsis lurida]